MHFVFLLLLFVTTSVSASQLDDFLSGLNTLQADFEQTVDAGDGISNPLKGVFYLKRPGKFRWDYAGKDAQLIVADGKTVWLLDREMEQVSHQGQKSALRGTPAQLLSSAGKVESYFTIQDRYTNGDLDWTTLKPKDGDSQMETIRIAFRDRQLSKLEMDDKLGQTIRFNFSGVKRNPGLQSSLFVFQAPKGFDVWEH
jgi:outer membrane lipoprotein carrier protein